MSKIQNRPKVAAKCTTCSKIYTAWQRDDGSLHLIGQGPNCKCGSADFRPLTVHE